MTDLDRESRPIRIVARRRPRDLAASESASHPRRPSPALSRDAAPAQPLHPGSPYYCSWDLESCLRYWA